MSVLGMLGAGFAAVASEVWAGFHNSMSRADRRRWQSCQNLDELGEATALWLEGSLASQPGYAAGYGPDPETIHLVPVLAAANRAGYVTVASQPGESGYGYDGAHWQQRSAVEGFCDERARRVLRDVCAGTGLRLVVRKARRRTFRERGVVVTTREGHPVTDFAGPWSIGMLADHYADAVSEDAFDDLVDAWQVTIVDPVWGRDDVLWLALQRFVDEASV